MADNNELAEEIRLYLAKKIRRYRGRLGRNQYQYADDAGVVRLSVQRFELGYDIHLDTFIKLVIAAGGEGIFRDFFPLPKAKPPSKEKLTKELVIRARKRKPKKSTGV